MIDESRVNHVVCDVAYRRCRWRGVHIQGGVLSWMGPEDFVGAYP